MLIETFQIDLVKKEVVINGEKLLLLKEPKDSPTGETGGRDVYIGSHFVVKDARSNWEYHREFKPEDQKHFAPVLFVSLDRTWYIQERVDCERHAEFTDEDWNKIQELMRKYNLSDMTIVEGGKHPLNYDGSPDRMWAHNWTVNRQGTPVIFDYVF